MIFFRFSKLIYVFLIPRNLTLTANVTLNNSSAVVFDPNPANNGFSLPNVIIPYADLALTSTVPTPVSGAALIVAYKVSNSGPSSVLSSLIYRATFTAGLVAVAQADLNAFGCTLVGNGVVCVISNAPLLAASTFTFALPYQLSIDSTNVSITITSSISASEKVPILYASL